MRAVAFGDQLAQRKARADAIELALSVQALAGGPACEALVQIDVTIPVKTGLRTPKPHLYPVAVSIRVNKSLVRPAPGETSVRSRCGCCI